MTARIMDRAADISECGRYRYTLVRRWSKINSSIATFIMCNPSIADADIDDPTIVRCIGFAQDWGMGGLHVVNLWAYRATKPKDLFAAEKAGVDIVGPRNGLKIVRHAMIAHQQGWPLVAAWGANGRPDRVEQVLRLPYVRSTLQCLGTTKSGQPRHPLMLPKTARLEPWTPKEIQIR